MVRKNISSDMLDRFADIEVDYPDCIECGNDIIDESFYRIKFEINKCNIGYQFVHMAWGSVEEVVDSITGIESPGVIMCSKCYRKFCSKYNITKDPFIF